MVREIFFFDFTRGSQRGLCDVVVWNNIPRYIPTIKVGGTADFGKNNAKKKGTGPKTGPLAVRFRFGQWRNDG